MKARFAPVYEASFQISIPILVAVIVIIINFCLMGRNVWKLPEVSVSTAVTAFYTSSIIVQYAITIFKLLSGSIKIDWTHSSLVLVTLWFNKFIMSAIMTQFTTSVQSTNAQYGYYNSLSISSQSL